MRGNEVFQHREALTEVRSNRTLNNIARWLGHQTAHTRELLNLLLVTTSTGINHQEERVDNLVSLVVLELTVECISNIVRSVSPNVDHLLVSLIVCNHTITILLRHFLKLSVCLLKLRLLLLGHDHVDDSNRNTRTGSFHEAE